MNNFEIGKELIQEADRIFNREVKKAIEDQDYNIVVRRSQEVVELALKGALRILGIDYPKVHEVSDIFAKRLKEKLINFPEKDLEKIKEISVWLTESRTPAFYLEKKYEEEDAKQALSDSGFVLQKVKEIFQIN